MSFGDNESTASRNFLRQQAQTGSESFICFLSAAILFAVVIGLQLARLHFTVLHQFLPVDSLSAQCLENLQSLKGSQCESTSALKFGVHEDQH
ncbi:hypothetical protein N7513_003256 [Penicillium frequentans]|nr:hypothetical protein N7513_003256 [Penicillium glabrum]